MDVFAKRNGTAVREMQREKNSLPFLNVEYIVIHFIISNHTVCLK